jgi:hypothetical protein
VLRSTIVDTDAHVRPGTKVDGSDVITVIDVDGEASRPDESNGG